LARINTYTSDNDISANDKVIGSDNQFSQTRNYTFGDIGDYLNAKNVVSILGQNNYVFQSGLNEQGGRSVGSISFESYGGVGTSFSAVTSLIFSNKNTADITVDGFISSLVNKNIIIGELSNPNNYGHYRLDSFGVLASEPTFYRAQLTFVAGNGSFVEDGLYGLALYSLGQGATWGSISGTVTNQADLVSYVTSERANYPVVSPNGTSYIIVAGNDGTLQAIPPDSTAPSITSIPTISGTLNVGETLRATAGNVSGEPTPTQVLQWQRSDDGLT